jgi:ABC-type oligopeptide transport system ATPase subunit
MFSHSKYMFISYSRQNSDFVEQLINDLDAADIVVWLDRTGLRVGTESWQQAIREAIRSAQAVIYVGSPEARESRYVRAELAIAEMYRKAVYPIWASGEHWADSAPMEWISAHYEDFRGDKYQNALPRLIEVLLTKPLSSHSIITERVDIPPDFEFRNPYKGLRPFYVEDREDFFGRERYINELLEELDSNDFLEQGRLLAIIGPSGSGKSSIVRAGLLPQLQEGGVTGSDKWIYLNSIFPGVHPIEELSSVLANALDTSIFKVQEDLEASIRGLHLRSRQLTQSRNQLVVIFIDQFEEIFTQTINYDERKHFIDLLVTAATEPNGQVLLIITFRADFYDRPMDYPKLGKLLERNGKSLISMTLNELRAVIEKPADLPDVQLRFEEGLVGDLLYEVRNEISALPLLQFTLDLLVQNQENGILTHETYERIGRVRGALARHADTAYCELPSDEHREMTRILFLRLIEPGVTELETTRRRAFRRELILPDKTQTKLLEQVAKHFVDRRLLTTDFAGEEATIEVSHEALIREWRLLAKWVELLREDIHLQQIISNDAREWIRHGKRTDDLYRGNKLVDAREWAQRNIPNTEEMEFIQACVASEMRLELEQHAETIKTLRFSIRWRME